MNVINENVALNRTQIKRYEQAGYVFAGTNYVPFLIFFKDASTVEILTL